MKSLLTLFMVAAAACLSGANAATPTPTPTPTATPAPTPQTVGQNFGVAWDASPGAPTSYKLEWGTTDGGPFPNSVTIPAPTTTYRFTTFATGRAYMVVVAVYGLAVTGYTSELILDVVSGAAPGNLRVTDTGFAQISTRGRVEQGDDVMIAGFIVNHEQKMVVRGIGPSLKVYGLDALDKATIELHDPNGATIAANDGWQTGKDAQAIADLNLAPTNAQESALLADLMPGAYTAILRGGTKDGTGLVELYSLNQ